MSNLIKLVSGDTNPQIKLTLTNEVTNNPINLTGCTVTLHLRAAETVDVLVSRPAVISGNPIEGICYIVWSAGDLDLPEGLYEGEIEVVNGTGAKETVYKLLKFKVREEIA